MPLSVDYYFTPMSPWTYLGHQRFLAMAAQHGAIVRPKAVDFGKVFPASGGLPLPQRAPQRQAYRLQELRRWRDHLRIPLNIQPKYFPVAAESASLLLYAAGEQGTDALLRLAGAMLRAVWAEERNLADAATLHALANEQGLDGAALLAAAPDMKERYEASTQEAIERQVFGAPTYAIGDELFWGQDRLDFVQRRLAAG